jgi:hypothetical protein
MADLISYKEKLDQLNELVGKLEMGDLTIEELSTMEKLTRELHERSIILRYKAFEQKVGIEVEEVKEEPVAEPEPSMEAEPEPTPEEESAIEFSIFDESEEEDQEETPEPIVEEPAVEETVEEEVEEEIGEVEEPEMEIEEHVSISKTEDVTEDSIETTIEVKQTREEKSFFDRLNLEDNSVASQFTGGKLDSLVGAFGLNQRLRFINNLFDGSSESFSEAVKVLDSQASLDEATEKAEVYAKDHDWDPEEENVIEFMTYVNRRYA